MLWALTFLEKPQTSVTGDMWCSLDLSPWLWYQFFRAPNSQSGWIKKSAINGHSFEMPLLLLLQKKDRDGGSPRALALLLPALTSHGNHEERILGHLGSEGTICHLSAKKALVSPRPTGRWQGEVFALEEKCSPRGKGRNKDPHWGGGIVKWKDCLAKGFLSF